MMISPLKRYMYTVKDFITLGLRVDAILNDVPENDEHAHELRQNIKMNTRKIISVYGDDPKSDPFTVPLKNKDGNRDATIAQISKYLRGARYDFKNRALAEAAAILYDFLKEHEFGSTSASYADQTAVTEVIFENLKTPKMQECMKIAGVDGAFETLRTQQDDFEDTYQKKLDSVIDESEATASEVVRPLSMDLYYMIHHLNSKIRLHPAQYADINKQIGALVDSVNRVAELRRTRKGSSEDDNDGNSNSGADTGSTQTAETESDSVGVKVI